MTIEDPRALIKDLSARLADAMGISAVHLVTNRVRDERELERARERIEAEGGFAFASSHVLPYDEALLETEPSVDPLLARRDTEFIQALEGVIAALLHSEEILSRCGS